MQITLEPIATITNKRAAPTDDFWGDTISEIILLSTRWTPPKSSIPDIQGAIPRGRRWGYMPSGKKTGPTSWAFVL